MGGEGGKAGPGVSLRHFLPDSAIILWRGQKTL